MKTLEILIPTYRRKHAIAALLTSLYYQSFTDFNIIIADQTGEEDLSDDELIRMLVLLLGRKQMNVSIEKNLPVQGMAQQRQFLFERSSAPLVLYLDDDLILEPWVIQNLVNMIRLQQCGFVGNAVIGLSFAEDRRPEQQHIEFWEGKVQPEHIQWGSKEWKRYQLHNAANILHVQEHLKIDHHQPKAYKLAWCGGCVLYDRQKLADSGAFSFWPSLPLQHCGEDVMAQWKVMEKFGGCGVIPSGVYHQELPTTVPDRSCNAPQYFINTESIYVN